MLSTTIGGKPNSSQRFPLNGTQISPRASRAIKLMASGVTRSAAITRSPSFSRFSSSTTMTNFPERKSSIAASMVENGEIVSDSETALTPMIVAAG